MHSRSIHHSFSLTFATHSFIRQHELNIGPMLMNEVGIRNTKSNKTVSARVAEVSLREDMTKNLKLPF
jgi:hypothetical protein